MNMYISCGYKSFVCEGICEVKVPVCEGICETKAKDKA